MDSDKAPVDTSVSVNTPLLEKKEQPRNVDTLDNVDLTIIGISSLGLGLLIYKLIKNK